MANRPTPVADRIAEDLAEHGDSVKACARRLGIDYGYAKKAWREICRRLGPQAA